MKISDLVEYRVNRFRAGYVFTYKDFVVPVEKTDALMKALSSLDHYLKIVPNICYFRDTSNISF